MKVIRYQDKQGRLHSLKEDQIRSDIVYSLDEKLDFSCISDTEDFLSLIRENLESICNLLEIAPGMPTELTAENGAKKALIGEFTFYVDNFNEGYEPLEVTVPWDTLKEIYSHIISCVEAGEITA